MKFVDYTSISIKAGDGGDGCIAFLREKFRPKGGPAGGDGGHGGNVYFQVSSDLSTLSDLNYKKHYFAGDGENGKGKNMHGKNGEDIFIRVPQGTIVIDSNTKQVIADLVKISTQVPYSGFPLPSIMPGISLNCLLTSSTTDPAALPTAVILIAPNK